MLKWTAKTEEAAVLVAEDDLSDEEIAARLGIGRQTLARWKRDDAFTAHVTELVERFAVSLQRYHIARRDKRVAALDDRWQRMMRLVDARAHALAYDTPGGETGLLVKEIAFSPTGDPIVKYSTDTGLLNAFLAHERQAAQETGQWKERADITSGDAPVTTRTGLEDVTTEQLFALAREVFQRD